MGEFWNRIRNRDPQAIRQISLGAAALIVWFLLLIPYAALAEGARTQFSGYCKSLNFFTQTSGFVPEVVDNPFAVAKQDVSVFMNMERFRLKMDAEYEMEEGRRFASEIQYDQQAFFGTFVDTGDFRIQKRQIEESQFLDLSQTFVEDDDAFYEQRLYRAILSYESEMIDIKVGRQQIPWGVGHFFTPTDLFNPFNPTQIELDERNGVDAVNVVIKDIQRYKMQMIYTPPGKQLHPQRYLARISRDIKGYEVGVLGGHIKRDNAVGFDFAGNFKDSAVRGEFLFRECELEKDFMKFTVNADYNFPFNIYGLLEYHFNGQGRRNPQSYQWDRFVRGEIQQLAKNYLAALLGYDITPLLRAESRTIFNMDDQSVFARPELRYELRQNFLLTAATQLFLGANDKEYGKPKNLFLLEGKYSF